VGVLSPFPSSFGEDRRPRRRSTAAASPFFMSSFLFSKFRFTKASVVYCRSLLFSPFSVSRSRWGYVGKISPFSQFCSNALARNFSRPSSAFGGDGEGRFFPFFYCSEPGPRARQWSSFASCFRVSQTGVSSSTLLLRGMVVKAPSPIDFLLCERPPRARIAQ